MDNRKPYEGKKLICAKKLEDLDYNELDLFIDALQGDSKRYAAYKDIFTDICYLWEKDD